MVIQRDLRQLVEVLDKAGKLVRIKEPIVKETELMPLVRWQFRGLPEEQRKAFLFENITSVKGETFQSPFLVGYLAASREIYALGLNCTPEEIPQRWSQAENQPIPPRLLDIGAVHEEVHLGEELLVHGGLSEFPFPVNTPGFDNAPYTTASHWVTRDPDTGAINIGNYRGQIKSPDRMGAFVSTHNHMGYHWQKYRQRGIPMPAALVVGAPPAVAYISVAKVPYGLDEMAVAGGLAGEPVDVVRCLTNDLLVPANAEIVLEGEISVDYLEPEAPFGEYTGYMGERVLNPVFHVKCITHRRNPIIAGIISQMAPSESSKIKQVAYENNFLHFLRDNCNIPTVKQVAFHEIAINQWTVIQMATTNPAQAWQALHAAVAYHPTIGKVIIAVDEDIDPNDPDSVIWALGFRMQPHRDILVTPGKAAGLDPSGAPVRQPEAIALHETMAAALLINATRPWKYPPVSLPRQDLMAAARIKWDELGLPPLKPRAPWHGYTLGYWTEEDEEEAQLALRGDHYLTGEKLVHQRRPVE